jgi:cytoskeletal protein CcmA (bactofilin family)
MWKSRKEDQQRPAPAVTTTPVQPAISVKEARPMEYTPVQPKTPEIRSEVAHIGKSVLVRGELSGSEDLYLDGEVEGSIELRGHSLTVGPNGRVKANINARDVVVHGKVEGKVQATGRVELKKSAVQVGDITTQRIIIEDGAFFKGGIDIQKETPAAKPEVKTAVAAASVSPSATPAQASLIGK